MKSDLAISSLILLYVAAACSPLKTSSHDERIQLELTLHEMQTNLDDLRHDINCFQTELQILDGRIKYNENTLATLKSQDLEKQQARLEQLAADIRSFEHKWHSQEKSHEHAVNEVQHLAFHANETTLALTQCKARIEELEQQLIVNQRRFTELNKLKGNIEFLAKSLNKSEIFKTYKVRAGDTLEKIAKHHKIEVSKIKQINQLEHDRILVGQELKIPDDE